MAAVCMLLCAVGGLPKRGCGSGLWEWDEVVAALADEGVDEMGRPALQRTLGRDASVMSAYVRHVRTARRRHGSVAEYILSRYFGGEGRRALLLPNKYPYRFAAGLRHDVVWVSGANITAEEVSRSFRSVPGSSRSRGQPCVPATQAAPRFGG
eukprot:TRINITY_DN13035_c0_g1_i1.p2 TRINITY_DN13035_c0_g1~~TRINITY_DN13035_c0_g1_i1.p2  ORF type:complete len:153 (+),score=48.07 TRINITY_DN13035_c0_g1_i1:82-540(+)